MKSLLIATILLFPILNNPLIAQTSRARSVEIGCSQRLHAFICARQEEALRDILEKQAVPLPSDWRWLIVSEAEWRLVKEYYGLKYDYAFTHVGERRTVLNSALFERFDVSTWRWAVAHESAHVVCDFEDERLAERAASRILRHGFVSADKTCYSRSSNVRGD